MTVVTIFACNECAGRGAGEMCILQVEDDETINAPKACPYELPARWRKLSTTYVHVPGRAWGPVQAGGQGASAKAVG